MDPCLFGSHFSINSIGLALTLKTKTDCLTYNHSITLFTTTAFSFLGPVPNTNSFTSSNQSWIALLNFVHLSVMANAC